MPAMMATVPAIDWQAIHRPVTLLFIQPRDRAGLERLADPLPHPAPCKRRGQGPLGRLTTDLAARYRFRIRKSAAILRVKLANVTDVFGWRVSGGGGFRTNAPRRLTGSIIADF